MKQLIIFVWMFMTSIFVRANFERYYIGDMEVSQKEFLSVDHTAIRSLETWQLSDTTLNIITLDMYFRIDSITDPGNIIITRKTEDEIALIDSLMRRYKSECPILQTGDIMPGFTLEYYLSSDGDILNYDTDLRGKVLLINFWATWCGPCLQELRNPTFQSIINEFKDDGRFVFLPVSVNHDKYELDNFFNSPAAYGLDWLKTTAWDKNGALSGTLSKGGIPLTLLIDTDGAVRLNESGALLSDQALLRLKAEIVSLLK